VATKHYDRHPTGDQGGEPDGFEMKSSSLMHVLMGVYDLLLIILLLLSLYPNYIIRNLKSYGSGLARA